MSTFDWFIVGFLALGALVTISQVGKPRKPITSGQACITVLIDAGLIAWLVVSHGG